jgi:hypothetical protein
MVELAGLKSGRSQTNTIGHVAGGKAPVEPAIDEQLGSHPRACGGTAANWRVRQ